MELLSTTSLNVPRKQYFENLMNIALSFSSSYFFYLFLFFSNAFTIHRTSGEGGVYQFNSSLPLLPASQTRRHKPGDC